MRSLVWFRSDLRSADNTALYQACRGRAGVVALFVVSPGEWRAHDVAPARVDLTLRTLGVLSTSLDRLNVPLIVTHAATPKDVPAAVLKIARDTHCGRLFFNREYELNESRRDEAVTALFEQHGLSVSSHDDQTIIAPGAVRTQEGRAFTVFTPFRKRWMAVLAERDGAAPLAAPARQPQIDIQPTSIPPSVEGFATPIAAALWPAGELEAAKRLDRFTTEKISGYTTARNHPALDSTSAISPYLTVGALSPRQCLAAALNANASRVDSGRAGPVQWITELVWREFYIHIVHAFPRVCMHRAFKPATDRIPWSDNDEHFERWSTARTGVPIVDAAMRQLLHTGWMHNRLRMITAMYLTKDLFIDWRRGEQFFMNHLVDGFLASNNGGWQWSASTGTDAAPYFRIFNPVSQSRTCDPKGEFIRRYCPELTHLDNNAIHEPFHEKSGVAPLMRGRLDYPPPLVDHRAARDRVLKAFKALS